MWVFCFFFCLYLLDRESSLRTLLPCKSEIPISIVFQPQQAALSVSRQRYPPIRNMGTRGLLGLIIAARRRASYNHWSSYPSAMGEKIVQFLLKLSLEDRRSMAMLAHEIIWVDQEKPPTEELQEHYSALGFSDLTGNRRRLDDWYCLLRKVQGADALPAIQNGTLKHMPDDIDFAKDSVFCEWAYFIDLEEGILETWKGFQEAPTTGNPFGDTRSSGKYYPVKLVDTVKFDNLSEGYMVALEERYREEDDE